MKKRFTDADIWQKPWFRKIPSKAKNFWFYILSACDAAGVWESDFELASFYVGQGINEDDLSVFGDRIQKIDDSKFWVVGFVDFQYGALSIDSAPHRSVMGILKRHGLLESHMESSSAIINNVKRTRKRLTQKAKNEILLRDRFTCQYCGKEDSGCGIDHILPISKGGGNENENLVACCVQCNSEKSDFELSEWYKRTKNSSKQDRIKKILDTLDKKLIRVKEKEEEQVKEQVKRNEEVSTNKKTYVLESENVRDLNRSRRFDFFGLDEKLGFKDSDFANILAKGKLTFKQIQESIEYFEYDLSNDKIKKMRGSPRSFFFGILNNGNTYSKNKDFQSKAEVEAIKQAEEDKQKAFEQQQAEEEKQKAEQQNAWDNLPQAEKEKYFEKVRKIIPEDFLEAAEARGVIDADAFKQFVNDLKKSSRSSEQGLYCVMTSSEAEQRRGA